MIRKLLPLALLVALPCLARAGETQTVPKGVFVLDESYLSSNLDKRWNGDGQAQPLIDDVRRYEPGGGLQGTLTGRPTVQYRFVVSQLNYGVTDNLMIAIGVPLVLRTSIHTNLGWRPGDYQPQLGRSYSEDDFWKWAASMGQSRPADDWEGNRSTFADMVVGGRYRLPRFAPLQALGVQVAGTLLVALPTGHPPDPEELVSAGTTSWDLHSFGDAEAHVAVDKPLWQDGAISRVNLGIDAYYAYFRPRTYQTPEGTKYPLLMNYQPYVGDTYTIDPGDWQVFTVLAEIAPIVGPTRASIVTGGDLERAEALPPLLNVGVSYTHVHCDPTGWRSDSARWDYDRELPWEEGAKNMVRGTATVSLLRMGVPVQLYSLYRNQSLIPGRNTRAADSWSAGGRLVLKFW